MKISRNTVIPMIAVLVILVTLPFAVRETIQMGRVYVFSKQFLDDLPKRLKGPGRLRFILQPLVAIVLGIRGGRADAAAGRPPYVKGVLFDSQHRKELLRSGLAAIRDLVAMGIIMDSVSQYLIYGEVHPGAALLVGPVLITVPYTVSRALARRLAMLFVNA